MLESASASYTQPTHTPHPPPFYIFKAPNGVTFQRPIFVEDLLSSETRCLSSVPLLSKIGFPAKHDTFPATHFCRRSALQAYSDTGHLSSGPFSSHVGFPATRATFPAAHVYRTSAFQRHRPPFQRSIFFARRLSSDTGHLSSGPFSSHICRLASSIIRNWLASHYLIVS